MKGICKHCGCTETNACFHPDFGTCWWLGDTQEECSHCIKLKDFPGVIKPIIKKVNETSKTFQDRIIYFDDSPSIQMRTIDKKEK